MLDETTPAEVTITVSAGTDRRSRCATAGCTIPAYEVTAGLINGIGDDMKTWLRDCQRGTTKRRHTFLGRLVDGRGEGRMRTVTASIIVTVERRVEVFDTIVETDADVHHVALGALRGVTDDAVMWVNDQWAHARQRAREAGVSFTALRGLPDPEGDMLDGYLGIRAEQVVLNLDEAMFDPEGPNGVDDPIPFTLGDASTRPQVRVDR